MNCLNEHLLENIRRNVTGKLSRKVFMHQLFTSFKMLFFEKNLKFRTSGGVVLKIRTKSDKGRGVV